MLSTIAEPWLRQRLCLCKYILVLFCVCVQTDVSRYSVLSVSLGNNSTGDKIQIVLQVFFVRNININSKKH